MPEDLLIPIYVDTNSLLDILASIEGGFSIVEKVTTQSAATKGIDREVSADAGTEFGIPNVLSLLKVNLGYGANWRKTTEDKQETETERYHTYGSLFYRLREYLENQSLIKRLGNDESSWESIEASDFVEVHGMFQPNPLANSLEIIDRLIGIIQLLSGSTFAGKPNKKTSPEEREKLQREKAQLAQIDQIRKFLSGVLSDIEQENIRAFVVESKQTDDYKTVVLLTLDYLRDKTMKELSYKEYHLLGKVARKIERESDEAIDLLLGTGLGGVGEETLEELINAFDQMPGMNLPEINTKITGPALEVVPIAIYV